MTVLLALAAVLSWLFIEALAAEDAISAAICAFGIALALTAALLELQGAI